MQSALSCGLVLAYHSHHVVGDDYGHNDHVAFAQDLELITAAGFRIVSLAAFVDSWQRWSRLPEAMPQARQLIALTFDDGPVYDVADFVHPEFGEQPSFLRIMREFQAKHAGKAQPDLHATSFVIASPEARSVIERTFDAEYTYLGPQSMGDEWWAPAIQTGMIGIANHSWDHLHPALPNVAHSRQVRADFPSSRHRGRRQCSGRRCVHVSRATDRREGLALLCISVRPLRRVSRFELFPAISRVGRARGIQRRSAA